MKSLHIFTSVFVLLLLYSCTCDKPEGPEAQANVTQSAQEIAGTEQEAHEQKTEVPVKADMGLGHIKAKANEKTAEIEFDVKTAVLANSYDKFVICLSDVPNDEVRDSGQFPPSPENSPPYHRIVLGLESVPTAPGEFVLTKLSYSVKDPEMHFNFGWSGESVAGTLTIDTLEGELPEGPTVSESVRPKLRAVFLEPIPMVERFPAISWQRECPLLNKNRLKTTP